MSILEEIFEVTEIGTGIKRSYVAVEKYHAIQSELEELKFICAEMRDALNDLLKRIKITIEIEGRIIHPEAYGKALKALSCNAGKDLLEKMKAMEEIVNLTRKEHYINDLPTLYCPLCNALKELDELQKPNES